MTFPQLTGSKTRGDPRSPTPTEYYFHHKTSVSLLTCRSRTQLLRPRLPSSVPEAPQHQQVRIHIHMSTKPRKVTACECECVCVCVCARVCVHTRVSTVKKENYHFRCTEGKTHRLSNPKGSAVVLQHRPDKVRGEAALEPVAMGNITQFNPRVLGIYVAFCPQASQIEVAEQGPQRVLPQGASIPPC